MEDPADDLAKRLGKAPPMRPVVAVKLSHAVLRDVVDEHVGDVDCGDGGWLTTERPKVTGVTARMG
jgi:hypothetical protein